MGAGRTTRTATRSRAVAATSHPPAYAAPRRCPRPRRRGRIASWSGSGSHRRPAVTCTRSAASSVPRSWSHERTGALWGARRKGLGGEGGLELGLDALLGHSALDALGLGAVAEQDHRRDREHLILGRGLLVVIDVELHDPQVATLAGDLLEGRGDQAAWAAPGSPEVDEHW